MPILVSDPRTRVALQLGLAIVAAEELAVSKEDSDRKLGDALERAYKAMAASETAEQFAAENTDFANWRSAQSDGVKSGD